MNRVMPLLHSKNPYDGFDSDEWPLDLEGWNSTHPLFAELIHQARPTRIIEVGTWKGASAIHMARLVQDTSIAGEVICVDTFLGWPGAPVVTRNGYPQLYWQFLANVIKCKLTELITPFPQTSELAAEWLGRAQVTAGLVYIDGAHGFGAVYDDLLRYWPLVEAGGFLFGDDYPREGVRRAVDLFSRACRIQVRVVQGKWLIPKNQDVSGVDPHLHLERHLLGSAASRS
jgi:hypothetical protein